MNKKIILGLIWGFLFLGLMEATTVKVYAAGEGAEVNVPIQQKIAGQTVTYEIRECNGTTQSPLAPSNSFTLTGDAQQEIQFRFTEPGIYDYQVVPVNLPSDIRLSNTQQFYEIEIYVKYVEETLTPIVIGKNAAGEKIADFLFSMQAQKLGAAENAPAASPSNRTTVKQYPKTGEKQSPLFWLGLLVLSGILLLYVKKQHVSRNSARL